MNELTKDKITMVSKISVYCEKDVILAVEETIKRIEESKQNGIQDSDQWYDEGLERALQIIKEQFPIRSDSNQSQESEK